MKARKMLGNKLVAWVVVAMLAPVGAAFGKTKSTQNAATPQTSAKRSNPTSSSPHSGAKSHSSGRNSTGTTKAQKPKKNKKSKKSHGHKSNQSSKSGHSSLFHKNTTPTTTHH